MTQTIIQRGFAPLKKYLPGFIHQPIRCVATALLTPALFSIASGHFKSSFKMSSVTKDGQPIPWYTYPCIDFLKYRDFRDRAVLEFGGGNSTLWWASRAERVLTLEGDRAWHDRIQSRMPSNVDLRLVQSGDTPECLENIRRVLASYPRTKFDVIVIDGLCRYELIEVACTSLSPDGIVICDNAESFNIYDGFLDRPFRRIDFYGHAPGVVLPHCTSVHFFGNAFVFEPNVPIHVIAKEI